MGVNGRKLVSLVENRLNLIANTFIISVHVQQTNYRSTKECVSNTIQSAIVLLYLILNYTFPNNKPV